MRGQHDTAASSSAAYGQATVVSGPASNVLIYQTIKLIPGKVYQAHASRVAGSIGIYIGAVAGATTYGGSGSVVATDTNYSFTASTTTAVLSVVNERANSSATFTNISVK